jgi:hypothetical protein
MHRPTHLLSALLLIASLLQAAPHPVRAAAAPAPAPAAPREAPSLAQEPPGAARRPKALAAGASDGWWAQVQRDLVTAEYALSPREDTPNAWQAPNRAQNLRSTFTPAGLRVTPRDAGDTPLWEWGLSLHGYGTPEALAPIGPALGAPLALDAADASISYTWRSDAGEVREWYTNGPSGLKQNFTLQAPPPRATHAQALALDLAQHGALIARAHADGHGVDYLTAGGTLALRYDGLLVYDATGRALPASLALRPGGLRVHIDARGAVYPITVDPLATSPTWTAEGDQVSSLFGYSIATAGDVNGDSYSDVLVGAPSFDNGQTDEGRVYLYLGSAAGLSASAAWTAEGNQVVAWFGHAVETAGDVNGDGYSDVLVGAMGFDNGEVDEGRAYLYLGSATGLSASPAWTAEGNQITAFFGGSLGTAGDVNGDGYSDVLVGVKSFDNGQMDEGRVYMYLGGTAGLGASAAWTAEGNQLGATFGSSVTTAGDVNGDGYSDVVIGAHFVDNGQMNEGRAYLYLGGAQGLSTSAAWTAEGNQAHSLFGIAVGTAGDVNGDGYSDVLVGASSFTNGEADEGRAYLYLGGAQGLSTSAAWTAEGNQATSLFGVALGSAGDVNGDGYSDVLVGAPLFDDDETTDNEGRISLYLGSPTGLNASPAWTAEGEQETAYLGWSVGAAGDVNGDGYSDVLVSARAFDNGEADEGRAYLYLGSATGPGASSAWSGESNQVNAALGSSVATAGDVNGDGYSDVLVSAKSFDNGQTDEGHVYLYLGSATGLGATPAWIAESNQAYSEFGSSVATAGDVNGDGYGDVVIGARLHNTNSMGLGTDRGRAFLYLGSATGLSASPAWTVEGRGVYAYFGQAVGTAGDVNGDGYSDVLVGATREYDGEVGEGTAYLYLGGAAGLSASPAWTAEGNQMSAEFGFSLGAAGDVNGDGYSDVLVGAHSLDNRPNDEGRAYLYLGSPAGLGASPAWTAEGNQLSAEFGFSLGAAGDVNSDGYSDVLVGAPTFDAGEADEGRAYLYLGSATGLGASAAWTAEANQISAAFGSSVGAAGDVNGDGYSDILVGAPSFDAGEADEGRAYLYLGSPAGLGTSAAWTAEGDQLSAAFGSSVGAAGDVNGDGYSDILVGAPSFDAGEADEGRAVLYNGNAGAGRALAPQTRRSTDAAPIAYLGQSDSGTSLRLAARGHSPFGRGRLRLEWELRPLGTPFTGTPTGIGAWVDSGTAGAALNEPVSGLRDATGYSWRVRLRYHPASVPYQPTSRWLTQPLAGQRELRFRTRDTAVPAASLATSAPNLVTGAFTVTVQFSEPVIGLTLADVGIANGSASELLGLDGTSIYTLTVTPAADGLVTVSLPEGAARDAAGNGNSAATSLSRNADVTRPVATLTSGAPDAVNGAFLVTIQFSEPVTGLTLADVAVANGSASELLGSDGASTYTLTVTPAGDGLVAVSLPEGAARDAAQNPTSAAASLSRAVDTTRPGVTLATSAPEPTTGPFSVTVQFSEPVTGLTLADVAVGNGSASELLGLDGASTYTLTVTPAGDGLVTVSLPEGAARDAAQNPTTAATGLSRNADITRPVATLTSGAPDAMNGAFLVTIKFSEPVTGLTLADLAVSNGNVSNLLGSDGASIYTVTVTPAADGLVAVSLPDGSAQNTTGNGNTSTSSLMHNADLTRPVATLTSDAPDPVNGPFTITLQFSEPITGLTLADLAISNGAASGLVGAAGATAYTATVAPVADGLVTVALPEGAARDAAQNTTTATSLSRMVDATRPIATIKAAPAAASSAMRLVVVFSEPVMGLRLADFQLDGSTTPGVLTATLEGSGAAYTVTVQGMTGPGSIDLALGPGAAVDAAGNPSLPASGGIAFAPALPQITGLVPLGANPTRAAALAVRVTFSEPVTGLTPGAFSLGGSLSDTAITALVGSGASYTVTVSTGSGSGTLLLLLRDDDGVTSAATGVPLGGPGASNGDARSTLLTLDRTPPVALLQTPPRITRAAPALTLTVVYTDNHALAAASLGDDDLVLSGPGGLLPARLVATSALTDGAPLTVTYAVDGPSGGWQLATNGAYTLTLRPDAVHDSAGNPVAGSPLGTVVVAIQLPHRFLPLLIRQ